MLLAWKTLLGRGAALSSRPAHPDHTLDEGHPRAPGFPIGAHTRRQSSWVMSQRAVWFHPPGTAEEATSGARVQAGEDRA